MQQCVRCSCHPENHWRTSVQLPHSTLQAVTACHGELMECQGSFTNEVTHGQGATGSPAHTACNLFRVAEHQRFSGVDRGHRVCNPRNLDHPRPHLPI